MEPLEGDSEGLFAFFRAYRNLFFVPLLLTSRAGYLPIKSTRESGKRIENWLLQMIKVIAMANPSH